MDLLNKVAASDRPEPRVSSPLEVWRSAFPLALFSLGLLFGWLSPTRGRFELNWLPQLGCVAGVFAACLSAGALRPGPFPMRWGPVQLMGGLILAAIVLSLYRGTISYPDSLVFAAGALLAALCSASLASAVLDQDDAGTKADTWVQRTVIVGASATACIMLQQASLLPFHVSWITDMAPGVRPAGHFFQRNLASLLLVMGVAAVCGERVGKAGALHGLLGLLFVFCLPLTASRAGLLLLLFTAACWGWSGQHRTPARLGAAAAAAGVAGALYFLSERVQLTLLHLPSWVGDEAARRLSSGEGTELRWAIMGHALAQWIDHPWWGGGWGSHAAWVMDHALTRPIPRYSTHSHNLVTQLLAETGLVFALPVLLIGAWSLWRRRHTLAERSAAPRAWVNMVLILILLLHSLVEYPLWETFFLVLLFWCWQRTDVFVFRPSGATSGRLASVVVAGVGLAGTLWLAGHLLLTIDKYWDSARETTGPKYIQQRLNAADHASVYGLNVLRDLLIYTALPLSTEQIDRKLEIGERLIRYAPEWWLMERQAHLLALAGKSLGSAELLARACAMHAHHCQDVYENLVQLKKAAPEIFDPVMRSFRTLPYGRGYPDPEAAGLQKKADSSP